MFERKTSGSVVCPSCGSLVGVRDEKCYSCGRANPGLWGFGPALRKLGADFGFAQFVIGVCVTIYVLTLLVSGRQLEPYSGGLSFLSPTTSALMLFGMSGAAPVFGLGRWWTLLSASWLHGGFIHILFNMMWVRDLGPAMVDVIGPARTVIIYVLSGACGFLLSSVCGYLFTGVPLIGGGVRTMGASASIFGMLGALVHYGRASGSSLIRAEAMRYAVIMFLFGLFMPGIDNSAHAGGFLGGYATSAFFKPLQRERGDHLAVAAACLVASFLAIGYSIVSGFFLLR